MYSGYTHAYSMFIIYLAFDMAVVVQLPEFVGQTGQSNLAKKLFATDLVKRDSKLRGVLDVHLDGQNDFLEGFEKEENVLSKDVLVAVGNVDRDAE
jgi:hypothetical protein